jgi:hypothetical protein
MSLVEFRTVQINSLEDARQPIIKLLQKFSRIVKNPKKYRGDNYSEEANKNLTEFCNFTIDLVGRASTKEQLLPIVTCIDDFQCRFECRGHDTSDVLSYICVFIQQIP